MRALFTAARARGGPSAVWSRDAAADFESLWACAGFSSSCDDDVAARRDAASAWPESASPPRHSAPRRLSATGCFKVASGAGAEGALREADAAGALGQPGTPDGEDAAER